MEALGEVAVAGGGGRRRERRKLERKLRKTSALAG